MSNKALKMSEIVLVKYLFKEDWAPLEEVVSKNAGQFGEVHEVDNEKDLLMILESSPATLVIASVSGKEALTSVINFLKGQRRILKESNMKFAAVNFLNNKQVEAALMKMGCQEVMEPTMRDKALKFKVDFWKKALSIGQKKDNDVKLTLKDKQASAETEKAKVDQNPIQWVPGLKCVDDMWLIKNPNDVKKVLTKWIVKVMGPSPFVAQWTEVPGQRGVWKFNFKDGIRDTFHSADGHWLFKGEQKPEFIWKENLWMISGQNFQLFYQDEGEVIARFRATPQAVEVAKNSSYGLSRERAIIESFDQEILVKKGLADDNSKTEIEEDKKGDGTLTQDMSGEEAIQSKYKGAVTQELPDAPEEKKKLGIDSATSGRLKGKASTDNLGEGSYSGDVEKSLDNAKDKKKHDATSDRMNNTDGDAGTEDIGASKYKGKMEYAQSERKSNYGGDDETEDLGGDKWSNSTSGKTERESKEREEAESPIAKKDRAAVENEARNGKERPSQDRYDGKTETEDLGSSNWSNQKKSNGETAKATKGSSAKGASAYEADEQEEAEEVSPSARKARAEVEKERNGTPGKSAAALRGKSTVDDLGDDHYAGSIEKKKAEKERAEKERARAAEVEAEDEEVEASASSASVSKDKKRPNVGTDDIGSNHYSGKTKRSEEISEEEDSAEGVANQKKKKDQAARSGYQEDEKQDYGGRSQSDNLGSSHYKGKSKKSVAAAEEDEESSESVDKTAKDRSAQKSSKVDPTRKIRMLDDLLPEGEEQSSATDEDAANFEDPMAVDVPMERPRLVVNNSPTEKERAISAKGNTPIAKDKSVVASRNAQAEVEEEPVLGDDGKPVTNDQVTVKAVLTCQSLRNIDHIVHVDDFFDSTAIVKMKNTPPQSNEEVKITVSFSYQKSNKRVTVSGKCIETDADEEGEHYCTIELNESDRKLFEQFMSLYRLRQQHVTQFLKAAKGL